MPITNQSSQPSNFEPTFSHIPVLGKEIITGLNIQENGHYLDTTVGGGGHSRLILESASNTQITALDQDEDALIAAKNNLSEYGNRVEFVRSNFAEYNFTANTFDGIIADLGVSSYHLDNPERGFSFRYEADLDMRMDRRQSLNAGEIINHWDEVELADIFYKYGEERLSRRIAKRIVERIAKHSLKDSQWLKVLTKKPITAQEEEISTNPRSRSAKLRIAESAIS